MGGYFSKIWRLRHFWLAMVRNDLRSRYRHSVIGVGWSLLHPILMTIVLCTVFSRFFHAEIRTYAPFLLTGLTFWGFIVVVMNQGCQCFFQNESYIRQHPAPLAIYPLRTTLSGGFHFLLGLLVALVLYWCFSGLGNVPALVGLLPGILLLFVFGWSLAICMGAANVLFQDIQHLVEVLLQVLFYLTPIMYPPSLLRERNLEWLVNLNPLAIFLELLRQPILEGQLPSLSMLAMATVVTLLTMSLAACTLNWAERRMIFYL